MGILCPALSGIKRCVKGGIVPMIGFELVIVEEALDAPGCRGTGRRIAWGVVPLAPPCIIADGSCGEC